MKRIIAIALLVALLIPVLCGCKKDGNAKADEGGFRVGYAAVEIMPKLPTYLGGYGDYSRIHTGFLDLLYSSCVAVTDANDNTLLIINTDTIRYPDSVVQSVRKAINRETGIPEDHIALNASHSHSTPETPDRTGQNIGAYGDILLNGTVEAAKEALADRAPATMSVGKIDVEGMNFCKHYIMSDGSYAGDNFGDHSLGYVGHAHEGDPEVRLVKFTRADKDDVLMWNWQGHPLITGGINKTNISADYPGSTRMAFEANNPGCKLMFLQGCGGDMNTRSNIKEEAPTSDNKLFGQQLAAYLTQGMATMKEVPVGEVKVNQVKYVGQTDHREDHLQGIAAPVREYYSRTGDREGGNEMARAVGLNSVYHAAAIARKAKLGPTLTIEIDAYQIGELGIVTIPAEYFSQLGIYIRENSPYENTLTLGYTNGSHTYITTEFAFTYNPYECNQNLLMPGEGEKIADKLLEMLGELKG